MIRCYKCGWITPLHKPCRRPNEVLANLRRALRYLQSHRPIF